MSDVPAEVPIADERTRRIFGDLSFTSSKRGFDQAEVTAFLVNASAAVERMLGRLHTAEQRAVAAETKLQQAEQKALEPANTTEPTADDGLLKRTLALAEKTAVAAVNDARARAQVILTQAQDQARQYFAAERETIAKEWERIEVESGQLETLRLAVAAETMALEEVRSHLRSRIAAAAGELAALADNPDLLGYTIHAPEGTPTVPPPSSPSLAEMPPPTEPALAPAAEAELPSPEPAEVIAASSISAPDKTFEGTWASHPEDPGEDEAFQRFFSDDVEPEPTQQWILAG
jgi:cell division septum initiation protein DivIVA